MGHIAELTFCSLNGRGVREVKKFPTANCMEGTDAQPILGHASFMAGKILSYPFELFHSDDFGVNIMMHTLLRR